MSAVERQAFELAISVAALKEQLLDKTMHGQDKHGQRITAVTIADLQRVVDYFDNFDIEVKKIPATGDV